MERKLKVEPKLSGNAELIITDEYLIVKGNHYNVQNGYLSRSNKTRVVKVEDIMNMEYITLRSKKLLMMFIMIMFVFLFCGTAIKLLSSVATHIVNEVQSVNDEEEQSIEERFEQKAKNKIIIYTLLLIISAGCLVFYFFKPNYLFFISAADNMIAVKRIYYHKEELDEMIMFWKNASL